MDERAFPIVAMNIDTDLLFYVFWELRYIQFHVSVVRPHLENLNIEAESLKSHDQNGYNGPLLLNSRTGQSLSVEQVLSSFRCFLREYDENLKHITTMSIRPSYATMMYRAYSDGKVFSGKSKIEFLEAMAVLMNTSVEQLESTYIALDSSNFKLSAKEMARCFQGLMEGQSASEDEGEVDVGDVDEAGFDYL